MNYVLPQAISRLIIASLHPCTCVHKRADMWLRRFLQPGWKLILFACFGISASGQSLASIVWTSPNDWQTFQGPANVTLSVADTGGSGVITQVQFFNGSTLLATDTVAPYSYNWNSVPAGTYSLSFSATGPGVSYTGSRSIVVTAPPVLGVSLTSPANGSAYLAQTQGNIIITLSATATAGPSGSISKVDFYSGSTLLGTDTSAPYSYSWSSALAAGSYTLTAKVTDTLGATSTSSPAVITVNAPVPPTVSLTAPANGTTYQSPTSITLNATATAGSGDSISNVQFYSGSTLLGTDTSAPYSYTWSNVLAGTYTLTAKANAGGGTTTSGSATVTVNAGIPPSVSLTAPTSGTTYQSPASINLTATASASSGKSISKVEFFNGSTLIKSDTSAPYSYTWSSVQTGSYTLTAKATDSLGATTTSSPAVITVSAVAPPTLSLTAPVTGTTYQEPASVTMTATASASSGGSISKVEFFNGSTLLGTDTSAPYSHTWSSVPAGSYTLTAKATDSRGPTTNSNPAAITVNTVGEPDPTPDPVPDPEPSTSTAPAGTTPGSIQINQDGAASYSIPIQVPPGTAGMAPALSITYSSTAGNGLLGMGWSIGGLSAITRCPKTFVQDGIKGNVNLDGNDRFCLDGQRLMAISGTYGASGTEYRTEIESFSKIISNGTSGNGPTWFKVWSRSGQILEYGNTTDSRIEAKGVSTVRVWAANKISDTKGNYLTISYVEDSINGQFYPNRIDYTGNTSAGLSPYNSVRFVYSSRPDVESAYVAGKILSLTKRLTNVQTYSGTGQVRGYRLAYQQGAGTARSQLSSITECSGSTTSVCLPATTFIWQDASPSLISGEETATNFAYSDGLRYFITDADADGKSDLIGRDSNGKFTILQSDGTAFSQSGYLQTPLSDAGGWNEGLRYFVMDINGDGSRDIVVRDGSGSLTTYEVKNGTLSLGGQTIAGLIDSDGWNSGLRYFVMDVNGDGRDDFVTRNSGGNLSIGLSNGTTFVNAGSVATGWTDAAGWNSGQRFFSMDVNGDGRGDLVARDASGSLTTWLSNGTTFTNSGSVSAGLSDAAGWNGENRFFTMDVNGDGMGDLVARDSDGNLTSWLSNGITFANKGSVDTGLWQSEWDSGQRYFTMDINGDGKGDIVTRDEDGILSLWLSDGTTFTHAGDIATGWTDGAGWDSGQRTFTMDVNGDGKGDLVGLTSNGTLQVLIAGGSQPDLMTTITNGLGATTTITYKPITDGSVYTKNTTAMYPMLDVQTSMYVVSEVNSDNGIGGQSRVTYSYIGAKADLLGRGFLGFGQVDATNTQNGFVDRVIYRQDYPYAGLVHAASKITSTGTYLNDIANVYGATPLPSPGQAVSTRYFPYVAQTTTKTNDLAGAFVSWTTTANQFDAYGNTTQAQVEFKDASGSPDGYSKTVTSTFNNDAANWIIGRRTGAAVTSTIPGGTSKTRTAAYAYDTDGLLTQETIEPGDPTLKLITSYAYNAFGNRTGVSVSSSGTTTPPGIATRTSSAAYDSKGRYPVSLTNALSQVETRTYDDRFGALASLKSPNLLTTTWTYDGFGRQLTETRVDGTRITKAYKRCTGCWEASSLYVSTDHTVVATGANVSPPVKDYHDTLGQLILSQTYGFDGTPIFRVIQYDDRGRVMQVSRNFSTGAPGWSHFAYDDLGRVTSETAPDSTETIYTYSGLTASKTNANGQTSFRVRNSQGDLVEATDAAGTGDASSISYAYGPFGNLIRTTDTAGNVIAISYDLRGRKLSMTDPDLGTRSYGYNVLGERISETNAKNQTTTFTYDKLGRITKRTEPDLISDWVYDSCTKGIGKLCQATAANGYKRVHSYDSMGRPSTTSTTIDVATPYSATTTYDAAGRVATQSYPTGFAVKHVYNAQGYLAEVRNNAGNALYWKANAANADDQVTSEQLGNGLTTTRTFDPATGRLTEIVSGLGGAVQNQSYAYDPLGNLTGRSDANVNVSESFGYDAMNRLISSSGSGVPGRTISYNAIGNITAKAGVGSYSYGAKPHAVASVTGTVNGVVNPSFAYDANGNLASGAGRTLTWSSFDMPVSIAKGAATDSFLYGPEHQRIRQTSPSGTTVYLFTPHYEKETRTDGLIEHKHYLYAGSGLIGLYTQRSSNVNDTRYFHTDHLGSVSVVTNETGAVVERLSYDAWGKRRQPTGADDPTNSLVPSVDRGYTGHEQLDVGGMGLVHMNGRIYDPLLGRVMSADPIVSDPTHSQSFNRYSYVWNNPLKYTDPSGYEITPYIGADGDIWYHIGGSVNIIDGPLGPPASQSTLGSASASLGGQPGYPSDASNLLYYNSFGSPSLGGSYAFAANNTYVMGGVGGTVYSNTTTTTTSTSGGTTTSTTTTVNLTTGGNGCSTNCNVSGGGTPTGPSGAIIGSASSAVNLATIKNSPANPYNDTMVGRFINSLFGGPLTTLFGGEYDVNPLTGYIESRPKVDKFMDFVSMGMGPELKAGISFAGGAMMAVKGLKSAPLHHICTNKNCVSVATGGPWTPRFEAIFEKAGMKLGDSLNKIAIPGHAGPHPEAYHQAVYRRLTEATDGLSGTAYSDALQIELKAIATELRTPSSALNNLVTKP